MTAQSPGPDAVARDEVGEVREALARLIAEHTEEVVRYAPNGHPDHNRWSWLGDGHSEAFKDQFREIAEAVLASGLVVPVGEGERLRERAIKAAHRTDEMSAMLDQERRDHVPILDHVRKQRDRAVAQVAAVRALAEEWDAQDDLHEWGSHWESRAAHRLRAALDTAPASPTTTGADS